MKKITSIFIEFVIGLTFGSGLVIAGMTNPAKVQNFLDLASISMGTWDPSLAFVMGGGVVVAFIGFKIMLRREGPLPGDNPCDRQRRFCRRHAFHARWRISAR